MPTTYARWILGISIRFGDNLSKMCPFVDFNRSKLGQLHQFTEKAQQWRANPFTGNGASM